MEESGLAFEDELLDIPQRKLNLQYCVKRRQDSSYHRSQPKDGLLQMSFHMFVLIKT